MDKMTVEEFIDIICTKNCGSLKSDLAAVVRGLLSTSGVYSAKDVLDYIENRMQEEGLK